MTITCSSKTEFSDFSVRPSVVLAPDSFKESRRAAEVVRQLVHGVRAVHPDADCHAFPMTDGGEGFLETLSAACGGVRKEVLTSDPLRRPKVAEIGLLTTGDGRLTAVVEVARAIGLEELGPSQRRPLATSSFGLGALLRAALAEKPDRILVGLGGSATVDGGVGFAQAMGAEFFDVTGERMSAPLVGGDLGAIARVDCAALRQRFAEIELVALCDVSTPVLDRAGKPGAARLYGPQKGASPQDVELLSAGLANLFGEVRSEVGSLPGGGAAGGLGAGLVAFCGARLVRGVAEVIRLLGLRRVLATADLVLTGEGALDEQTSEGKVVAGVAAEARRAGVPVVAIVGQLRFDIALAREQLGLDGVLSLAERAGSIEQALACTDELLRELASEATRRWLSVR